EQASVSVFDHGLLYGDGVFEGIRVYAGRTFKLPEHIRRLYQSARAILLELPMGPKDMENTVREAVARDGAPDSYVRVVVTRGVGSLGLDPSTCSMPTVIVIVDKVQLYPKELCESGIRVITASVRRVPPECLDPRIKSLNYLNNVLARAEAARAGCQEALLLGTDGQVAECSADNVFVVKGKKLMTPHPSHGALDGITMRTVMELAKGRGLTANFETLTLEEIYSADECFLTGTGAGIVPVIEVDGRVVGAGVPGAVTLELSRAYSELVTST
ncbi:hypothetical protein LCGC14_2282510, partial [marine sediment metagenome]